MYYKRILNDIRDALHIHFEQCISHVFQMHSKPMRDVFRVHCIIQGPSESASVDHVDEIF
jgi:hypothetical protein